MFAFFIIINIERLSTNLFPLKFLSFQIYKLFHILKKEKVPIVLLTNSIENGSTIILVNRNVVSSTPIVSQQYQVFVRGIDGKHYTFWVSTNESVDSFKKKIQDKNGVPPDQQRLIYTGKQFESGNCLSDYGVQKDSTINLVLRLKGGL